MTATDHLIPLQPCRGCGLPTVPMSNPCTACRRAPNERNTSMSNPISVCAACRVHAGAWPVWDPRCPGCRNAGRQPRDPDPRANR